MFARFSNMMNNVGARIPSPGGGRDRDRDRGRNPQPSTSAYSRPSSTSGQSSSKKHCSRADAFNTDKNNGEDDEQSCQVDNSTAVIAKIANLYAERLMSDITLIINNVHYPAHRLILCASSDVFQVMLMNPNWTESQESRIILQESPECADYFEDFLKYLYTGKLKLELSSVMQLLTLADKYNVKDMISLCLDYMLLHIPAAAVHSQLILWFQYTSRFGAQHTAVSDGCRNFIKWNLEVVAKAEDFTHLDVELLIPVLAEDDLVVYDEYVLYTILEFWIQCQTQKYCDTETNIEAKMLHIVEETMNHIRFPMMTPRQLADLIPSPLVRKYNSLMEKMAIAMAFHNAQLENFLDPIMKHPFKNKFFTPRLYCTDQWSVCIATPFDRLQFYQSQTLVFSTPCSFAENSSEKQIEWVLDFYPKAVQFQRCFMIEWHANIEVPEYVLKTIRLSVACKSEEGTDVRVQIGVLVAGYQDDVEHVRQVVRKNYIFSDKDRVLNLDNLLPYGDLNLCATCDYAKRVKNASYTNIQIPAQPKSSCPSCNSGSSSKSPWLGKEHSDLKIRVVITPFRDLNNCF